MRARTAASIGFSAIILLTATGCGFITPQATTQSYNPSDGTSASVGDIQVLNALVISNDGDEGNLVANVVNGGTQRVTVTLQFESGSTKVDRKVSVAANSFKSLGTDEVFLLEGMDTQPGGLLPVFVQYDGETGKQMMVPVLDNSLAEYSDLLP